MGDSDEIFSLLIINVHFKLTTLIFSIQAIVRFCGVYDKGSRTHLILIIWGENADEIFESLHVP